MRPDNQHSILDILKDAREAMLNGDIEGAQGILAGDICSDAIAAAETTAANQPSGRLLFNSWWKTYCDTANVAWGIPTWDSQPLLVQAAWNSLVDTFVPQAAPAPVAKA